MRIAVVTPDFPPWALGGAPNAVRELAELWAAEGHEVTVIASRPRSREGPPAGPAAYRTVAFELREVPRAWHEAAYFSPMTSEAHRAFRTFAESATRRYDVVVLVGLLETVPREFLRHATEPRERIVSLQFGVSAARGHAILHPLAEAAYRTYGRRLGRRLARVVVFSREGEEEWERYVRPGLHRPPERGWLGINGEELTRELEAIRVHPEPAEVWRTHQGIRAPYLLVIGRNDRAKGFDTALEAFGLIAREVPDLAFVLAGDRTPFTEELERRARELGVAGRVRILGRVSGPERMILLSGARLFMIPSRKEGYGLNAVLARVTGVPTVATSTGAHAEILDDPTRFLLVPPEDPAGLARAIRAAIARTTPPLSIDPGQLARFDRGRLARQLLTAGPDRRVPR